MRIELNVFTFDGPPNQGGHRRVAVEVTSNGEAVYGDTVEEALSLLATLPVVTEKTISGQKAMDDWPWREMELPATIAEVIEAEEAESRLNSGPWSGE